MKDRLRDIDWDLATDRLGSFIFALDTYRGVRAFYRGEYEEAAKRYNNACSVALSMDRKHDDS